MQLNKVTFFLIILALAAVAFYLPEKVIRLLRFSKRNGGIFHVQLNKVTFFLIILVLAAVAFYLPEAAMAQSHEPRLIPLFGNAVTETGGLRLTALTNDVTFGTKKSGAGVDERFAVYGRSPDPQEAGIASAVNYRYIPYANKRVNPSTPDPLRLPNLESFFGFGGTLELVTTENAALEMSDIVVSEILWGVDTGIDDEVDTGGTEPVNAQLSQWIELYNTTGEAINVDYNSEVDVTGEAKLYLLFTPFVSHPNRTTVTFDSDDDGESEEYKVLDVVNTLYFGRWELPGKSARRPNTAFISAYRDIDYDTVEDVGLGRDAQLAGIPFGSYADSWKATPDAGRRNTVLRFVDTIEDEGEVVPLLYVATPGTRHTPDVYIESLDTSDVDADAVVINEVRNDTSRDNVDWIELKNISSRTVDLEKWELSIVTGVDEDTDLVDLPAYQLARGEILLILNEHPELTDLANGINIEGDGEDPRGLTHRYFVSEDLDLPGNKKFLILLRSADDKNAKDEAIEDYAGNGFFSDNHTTEFWPRLAQKQPDSADVADFGNYSFASRDQAWARIRYEEDDGYHKDAWAIVGTQAGIGYAVGTNLKFSPGTPGYENIAVKTQLDDRRSPLQDNEYDDGEISISEIMFDPGPKRNSVQWIELYNSSMTQAISLKGWKLEIRNLLDDEGVYGYGSFEFEDAVILPNQTLLLVSEVGSNSVSTNTVYNLYRLHRRDLGLARWPHLLLNPTGFYLKLTDRANPHLVSDDIVVDEVGNLQVPGVTGENLQVRGETGEKVWDLPVVNPGRRRSLVRLYGGLFKPNQGDLDGRPNPPDDGMEAEGWRRFPIKGQALSFYGNSDDLSSPGYRLGGPLPVALSSFRPVRMETGEVLIKWRTESELNNAGFNILRSENRTGEFKVINVKGIIPGQGTSSEMQMYTYTDTTAKPNVIYYYRIEDVSFDGARQTLATVRLKGEVSATGKLTTTWSALKSQM